MRIREARAAETEAIRRVHRASIEELGPAAYDPEQVTAWAAGCESADYAATIESDDGCFVVAERDGQLLGFGSLSFDSPEEYEASADAEVTAVYVHPSATREGAGTELLVSLERVARGRGVGTLGLSASHNALGFYEGHGYERVGTYEHEFSSDEATGVTGEVVEMSKDL
jgi:putative acetyltransferase